MSFYPPLQELITVSSKHAHLRHNRERGAHGMAFMIQTFKYNNDGVYFHRVVTMQWVVVAYHHK
jgi:hypothetical protein